jgi:HK97 family phage prohead protease
MDWGKDWVSMIGRVSLRPYKGDQGVLKSRDPDGKLPIRILSSTPDIDSQNDIVVPSAYRSSIDAYNERPVLFAFHDMNRPVGRAPAEITSVGLEHPKAWVSAGAPDIQILVDDGTVDGASVRIAIKDATWDEDFEALKITDVDLQEVSLVALPANRSTFVEALKGWCSENEERFKPVKGKAMLVVPKVPEVTPVVASPPDLTPYAGIAAGLAASVGAFAAVTKAAETLIKEK